MILLALLQFVTLLFDSSKDKSQILKLSSEAVIINRPPGSATIAVTAPEPAGNLIVPTIDEEEGGGEREWISTIAFKRPT